MPTKKYKSKFVGGTGETENEDILSVTSLPNTQEVQIMNTIKKYPSEISEKFYHIIFDCDFGNFIKNKSNVNSVVYGNVRSFSTDKIPIVYNHDFAVKCGAKLVNLAVSQGSLGNGLEKKYPYLGAIIVGLQFQCEDYKDLSYTNLGEVNKKDLSSLSQKTEHLITYSVNNSKRGFLSKFGFSKAHIVTAEYIARNDINVDNAFALLNLVPSLTSENIKMMKKIYDNNDTKKEKTEMVTNGELIIGDKTINTDMDELGGIEKAKYFNNKVNKVNKENNEENKEPKQTLEPTQRHIPDLENYFSFTNKKEDTQDLFQDHNQDVNPTVFPMEIAPKNKNEEPNNEGTRDRKSVV